MRPPKYGYSTPLHPHLRPAVAMVDWLLALAADAAARKYLASLERRAAKPGFALLPGRDTPLWNQLVRQVAPLLRKRGSKVRLARLLGISRQRLHICLKARTGALDAERTLFLLAWLEAERRGRPLS